MAQPVILGLMQIIAKMNRVILHTDDEVGCFITSDQPCTLTWYHRPTAISSRSLIVRLRSPCR